MRAKLSFRERHAPVDVLAILAVCAVAMVIHARCQMRWIADLPVGGRVPDGPQWEFYDEGHQLAYIIHLREPAEIVGRAASSRVHADLPGEELE